MRSGRAICRGPRRSLRRQRGLPGTSTARSRLTSLHPSYLRLNLISPILIYLIAIWALIHGISEIYGALKLRDETKGEWVPLIVGITSVIFGILLIVKPLTAGAVFTWLIGLLILIMGAFWLLLAYRAWSWKNPEVKVVKEVEEVKLEEVKPEEPPE